MLVCFSVEELILLKVLVVVLFVSVLLERIFFFYWVLFFWVRFCLLEKWIKVIWIIGLDVLLENVVWIRLLGLILIFVNWFIGKLFCFNDVILNVEVNCDGLFGVVLVGFKLKLMLICWDEFDLLVKIFVFSVLVCILKFKVGLLFGVFILMKLLLEEKISFDVVIVFFVFLLIEFIGVLGMVLVLLIMFINWLFIVVVIYYLLLIFGVVFFMK